MRKIILIFIMFLPFASNGQNKLEVLMTAINKNIAVQDSSGKRVLNGLLVVCKDIEKQKADGYVLVDYVLEIFNEESLRNREILTALDNFLGSEESEVKKKIEIQNPIAINQNIVNQNTKTITYKIEKIVEIKLTYFHPPVDSFTRISSHYGWRKDPNGSGATEMHQGIDISMPLCTPVYSMFSGFVEKAEYIGGYGFTIIISDTVRNIKILYAHLSSKNVKVKKGDQIKYGTMIAYSGATGHTTGPHLHLEFIFDDPTKKDNKKEKINLASIIDFNSLTLKSDTIQIKRKGKQYFAEPIFIKT